MTNQDAAAALIAMGGVMMLTGSRAGNALLRSIASGAERAAAFRLLDEKEQQRLLQLYRERLNAENLVAPQLEEPTSAHKPKHSKQNFFRRVWCAIRNEYPDDCA